MVLGPFHFHSHWYFDFFARDRWPPPNAWWTLTLPAATPQYSVLMRMRCSDAPIVVLGSGKTAMDCVLHLARGAAVPSAGARLRCVAGSGTWFMRRTFFSRAHGGPEAIVGISKAMMAHFDGTNGRETCEALAALGFMHTAIDGASSFAAGVCSDEEIAAVRAALSPAAERVVRAHFVGVTELPGGGLQMELRAAVDGRRFSRALEPGSFIINATGHIPTTNPRMARLVYSPLNPIVPVVSCMGRVLNLPSLPGFGGPSGNFGTHLYFLGRLTQRFLCQEMVRQDNPDLPSNDRARVGLELWAHVQLMHARQYEALPPHWRPVALGRAQAHTFGFARMIEDPAYPQMLHKLKEVITPGRCGDAVRSNGAKL